MSFDVELLAWIDLGQACSILASERRVEWRLMTSLGWDVTWISPRIEWGEYCFIARNFPSDLLKLVEGKK
jgi:hypothetical protein